MTLYKCIRAILLLLIVTSLTISSPARADPDVFVLNTSTGAPYATKDRTGFQDLIIAEIFNRIGLKAKVELYEASARALINANNKVDHGVAMRIKGLEKKFPNLVRVDERLIENDFVAYSKNKNIKIDGWKSLEKFQIAYIHGWVIFERNLGPNQHKHTVAKPDQMFTMLGKNRVDLVLYERWQGLQRAKISGIEVIAHEPPLVSIDMFMYMHKDYADLVPKMANALREMKADGTYQDIFNRTLKSLLPGN